MSLFDKINIDFFKPLNSKYKREFVEILLFLNDTINRSGKMSMARNDIRDFLENYLYENKWNLDFRDDEDFDEISKEIKDESIGFNAITTAYILSYLKKYKWISIEQNHEDLSKIVLIPYNTRIFIDFILDLTQDREQIGYIIRIHASLSSISEAYKNGKDMKDSYQHLINAYSDFQELIKALDQMNAKIKEYYENQLKMRMEDVLEKYMDEYYVGVIQKFIYPTLIDDSIRRYRGPIEDILDVLHLNEDVQEAIAESAKTYYRIKNPSESVIEKVRIMYSQLAMIENLTDILVERNSNYQQIAYKKIVSYFNQDQSIKGNITEILKSYQDNDEFIISNVNKFLNYNPVQIIFENQISDLNKKNKKKKIAPIKFVDEHIMLDNNRMNDFINYDANAKFTVERVNAYFLSKMQGQVLNMQSFEIQNDEDYIRSILIFINNKVRNPEFQILLQKKRIIKNGYELPGFIIRKEDNDHES